MTEAEPVRFDMDVSCYESLLPNSKRGAYVGLGGGEIQGSPYPTNDHNPVHDYILLVHKGGHWAKKMTVFIIKFTKIYFEDE